MLHSFWARVFAAAHELRSDVDPLWVILTLSLVGLVVVAAMTVESITRRAQSLRMALDERTRELEAARSDAQGRLKRAMAENHVLEERATELLRTLQELEKRARDGEARNLSLEKVYANLERQLHWTEGERVVLLQDRDQNQARIASLAEQTTELQSGIDGLESRLGDLNRRLSGVLERCTSQFSRVESELSLLRLRKAGFPLTESIQDIEDEIASFVGEISALDVERDGKGAHYSS